jgi:hypothetical protein
MASKKRPGGRKGSASGRVTPKGTKPPEAASKRPPAPPRREGPARPTGNPTSVKPHEVQHQNRRSGSRGNR